ncbi:MAG TPA: TMEM175 family protein [Actinomycetota bacterium]|nr:TMEM175 family protein [Actinomycetota bacterium]
MEPPSVRHAQSGDVNDTARLETFADGVMAIAITLLILEVGVPHVEGRSLGSAIARQWPSYVAFVVSFLTIGIIWVNHHHMFRLIARTNHTFLILNVLFLMTICILPWPTALLADYARDSEGATVAAAIYGGVMTAVSIMFNLVWRYAAKDQRLLVPGISPEAIARSHRNYLAGPVVYGAAVVMAFIEPKVSIGIYAALAVYWLLPRIGPRAELAQDPLTRPGNERLATGS